MNEYQKSDFRALILVNPASRCGSSIYRKLEKFIGDHFEYEVKHTEQRGHATTLARDTKCNLIIVCGGDGTVNEVANGIAERDDILIAPTFGGSGCDLSRYFGIRRDAEERIQEIAERVNSGNHIRIKLSRVTTESQNRYFIGVGDAGFGAEVAGRFETLRGYGKFGYVIGVIQTLIKIKPLEVEVLVDDIRRVDRAVMIMFARSKYYAGGMKISPNSDMFSDSARLIYLKWMRKLKFITIFPSVYIGKHLAFKEIDECAVRKLEVKTPGMPVDVEGEFAGYSPCTFTVTDREIRIV